MSSFQMSGRKPWQRLAYYMVFGATGLLLAFGAFFLRGAATDEAGAADAESEQIAGGATAYTKAVRQPGSTVDLSSFPTAASAGVPDGVTLRAWTGPLRTSSISGVPTEQVAGRTCRVFDGYDVDVSNGFMSVDDSCVVFRNSRFSTSTAVPNTGALVQQARTNELLVIEFSDLDGGPFHERGVNADYSDLVVRDSEFARFGNAAIEMNDRDGSASLTVENSYLYEEKGWPRAVHADGIQVGGAKDVTIRNNTVIIETYGGAFGDTSYVSNAAIGMWSELGAITGAVTIDGNLLAGGGYVVYMVEAGYSWPGEVSFVNNVFDLRFGSNSGIWGPLYTQALPSRVTWSGNTFGNGAPISLQNALSNY